MEHSLLAYKSVISLILDNIKENYTPKKWESCPPYQKWNFCILDPKIQIDMYYVVFRFWATKLYLHIVFES
jgi:hypothetical protein